MLKRIIVAVLLCLTMFAPSGAFAQAEPRVIVPDHPGGAAFGGCYRVNTRLYGPYRLTFCLQQRGVYQITGGGVTCNGRLDWRVSGRDINVQLRRTSCGNGVAWSADRMTCRSAGLLGGIIGFVIVPGIPNIGSLRCTYSPSVPQYRPVTFTARRYS